jgi:regulator of sigma D
MLRNEALDFREFSLEVFLDEELVLELELLISTHGQVVIERFHLDDLEVVVDSEIGETELITLLQGVLELKEVEGE